MKLIALKGGSKRTIWVNPELICTVRQGDTLGSTKVFFHHEYFAVIAMPVCDVIAKLREAE